MTATNPYIPQPDDQHTSPQYGSPEQPQQAQQTYGQYQGQPYTNGGQTPPEQPAYGAPYTQQPYNAQYGASYNAPYTAPYAQGYYYGQSAQTDKWNGLCIAGIAISALGTLFLVACIAFAVWVIGLTFDYIDEHPEVWDDDSLSQYDGQICFEDGTCMDTRDLPDDFSLPEYLDEFARSTQGNWVDTWQTAQGSAPITMELVD